jgi:endoribonuclease Dicer
MDKLVKLAQAEEDPRNAQGMQKKADYLRKGLPRLKNQLHQAAESLSASDSLSDKPLISDKLGRLFLELSGLRSDFGEGVRGIVFVEEVSLTYPLADLINNHFGSAIALPASGTSSMTQTVREKNIDEFRKGNRTVLVATITVEEGLDVPDCQFVVRYSHFSSTKSHVQGSGRVSNLTSRST